MTSGPTTSWQIDGETMETETLFSRVAKSLQMVTAATKLKNKQKQKPFDPWKKSYDKHRQRIKKQRHCFANGQIWTNMDKGPYG